MRPLPKLQTRKIIAVIRAEHRLVKSSLAQQVECRIPENGHKHNGCRGVGHCAVGALLAAAGYSERRLLSADDDGWGTGGVGETESRSRAARLLRSTYGLLPVETGAIEYENDKGPTTRITARGMKRRRAAVIDLVRFIGKRRARGIASRADVNWAEFSQLCTDIQRRAQRLTPSLSYGKSGAAR